MPRNVHLLLVLSLALSSHAEYSIWNDTNGEQLDWWQKTVIYQIYPLSFKDSDGDGYGDIKGRLSTLRHKELVQQEYKGRRNFHANWDDNSGITQNIQHLKNLGVDAVWLSPITKSPMKDFGYDVSNYVEIDPIFGTMDDFKALVTKLKELGIKLIMDFVPNHTSDQHEWFQKSVARDPKYKDYYVWVDPKFDPTSQDPRPPNNWTSVFGGSAWEYNSVRGQYYLHQFAKWQPDLNFRNVNVTKDLTEVMRFWMDLGASGFRMDAVNHLVEKEGFPDEPVKLGSGISDPNNYGYLDHVYTTNQPETFDVLAQFRMQLDNYSSSTDNITRVMITESYTTTDEIMKQYGNKTRPIAHFPFNFNLLENLGQMAEAFDIAISDWMENLPTGAWPNWVLGNHDNRRVGSRYGPDLIDQMNMILLLLPGTAVTYYGEEIGMVDNMKITFNETKDPLGIEAGPVHYLDVSRDPERTPHQWNDQSFSGFTKGNKTWLPVNSDYNIVNVLDQTSTSGSHYNIYRQLVQLRKLPGVQKGILEVSSIGTRVLAFKRSFGDEETGVVVAVNFGEDTLENINIGYVLNLYETQLKVNVTTPIATYRPGDMVGSDNIRLNPLEGLVFTFQQSLASTRSISITTLFLFVLILIMIG